MELKSGIKKKQLDALHFADKVKQYVHGTVKMVT